jgi:hypothetical protein
MKPTLTGWENVPNRKIYDRFSSISCSPSQFNELYQELAASLENQYKAQEKIKKLESTLKFIERDKETHDCTHFYRNIARNALK